MSEFKLLIGNDLQRVVLACDDIITAALTASGRAYGEYVDQVLFLGSTEDYDEMNVPLRLNLWFPNQGCIRYLRLINLNCKHKYRFEVVGSDDGVMEISVNDIHGAHLIDLFITANGKILEEVVSPDDKLVPYPDVFTFIPINDTINNPIC